MVNSVAAIGVAPGTPFDLKSLDPAVAKSDRGKRRRAAKSRQAEATWQMVRAIMASLGRYGTDCLVGSWSRSTDSRIARRRHVPAYRGTDGQTPRDQELVGTFPRQAANASGRTPCTTPDSSSGRTRLPHRLTAPDEVQRRRLADHQHPARIAGQGKGVELAAARKIRSMCSMRLYWPKKEIVDGAWKMPGVERVK